MNWVTLRMERARLHPREARAIYDRVGAMPYMVQVDETVERLGE